GPRQSPGSVGSHSEVNCRLPSTTQRAGANGRTRVTSSCRNRSEFMNTAKCPPGIGGVVETLIPSDCGSEELRLNERLYNGAQSERGGLLKCQDSAPIGPFKYG